MAAAASPLTVPVIADPTWQMTYGERFALEGLLTQLQPRLAIETGTAQGGSLRRIATHSEEVHAFDIVPEVAELGREITNAQFHIGDSATLLPQALEEFAAASRHVDFALIDGDHSRQGVKRDALAVIDSPACEHTVIVFHDSANDEVRAGLEELDLPLHPKVVLCMLDFVPGYLVKPDHPYYAHAAWNGLALVVLGLRRSGEDALTLDDRYSVAEVYQRVRAAEQEASSVPEPMPTPAPARSRALLAGVAGAAVGGLGWAAVARLRRR
jgi:hypothetical protein